MACTLDVWLGRWKLIPDSVDGFQEYAQAMKIPEELQEKMKAGKENMTVEIRRGEEEGSLITIRDSGAGKLETTLFRLGDWFTVNQDGLEVKNLVTHKDGKLYGQHVVNGQTSTSLRWLDGNKMYMETTGNGKTTKVVYQRV